MNVQVNENKLLVSIYISRLTVMYALIQVMRLFTVLSTKYFHGCSLNNDKTPEKSHDIAQIPSVRWIEVRWLVNCRVRSARTAADMSQDVCHRQRRSLNEFQSGRAKKTRAEHAWIKSCGASAAPREAPAAARPSPAASTRAPVRVSSSQSVPHYRFHIYLMMHQCITIDRSF